MTTCMLFANFWNKRASKGFEMQYASDVENFEPITRSEPSSGSKGNLFFCDWIFSMMLASVVVVC